MQSAASESMVWVSSSGGRLTAVSTAASHFGVCYGILKRRLSGGGAVRPPATCALHINHVRSIGGQLTNL